MSVPEWVWSAAGVLLAGAAPALGFILYSERRMTTVEVKLDHMEKRLSELRSDVMFAAEHVSCRVLHKEDDDFGLDALIDRYESGELTTEQLVLFVQRLQDLAVDDAVDPRERKAADILLRVLNDKYPAMRPV